MDTLGCVRQPAGTGLHEPAPEADSQQPQCSSRFCASFGRLAQQQSRR